MFLFTLRGERAKCAHTAAKKANEEPNFWGRRGWGCSLPTRPLGLIRGASPPRAPRIFALSANLEMGHTGRWVGGVEASALGIADTLCCWKRGAETRLTSLTLGVRLGLRLAGIPEEQAN